MSKYKSKIQNLVFTTELHFTQIIVLQEAIIIMLLLAGHALKTRTTLRSEHLQLHPRYFGLYCLFTMLTK